jgi:shikimate dehydrogenase
VAASIGVEGLEPGETPAGPLLLVNATPLGSTPEDPLPFHPDEISRARAVVDMVYGPEPTPLELAASEENVLFAGGLDVLLHQGIAQIAAFTGKVAGRDLLREALLFR